MIAAVAVAVFGGLLVAPAASVGRRRLDKCICCGRHNHATAEGTAWLPPLGALNRKAAGPLLES